MATPDVYTMTAEYLGIPISLVILIVIWTLVWKGLAMWKSAKKDNKAWFIIFLIVHTIGILEILYIFLFSELRNIKGKGNDIKRKETEFDICKGCLICENVCPVKCISHKEEAEFNK